MWVCKQNIHFVVLFLILISLGFLNCNNDEVDSIYKNGKIYTVNKNQPWAEAFAIKNGKFYFVGSNSDIDLLTSETTLVIDLNGRTVLPGLIDVHVHPLGAAERRTGMIIENPNDAAAILSQLELFASSHPELPSIRGEAWNPGVFPNDSPRKELLDKIVLNRPVFLRARTGHSAWVNSKALELAGINKDTPITDTFIYDKDPETGEPSGIVREEAIGAVQRILHRASPEVYAPELKKVLSEFNQFGFTSLKTAGGSKSWLEGAVNLENEEGLTIRLFPSWDWLTSASLITSPEETEELITNWQIYKTDMIYPRYVKVYYDGSPDSYTALLIEDYLDRPGHKGASNLPKAEMKENIKRFNNNGIGVITHVLGDGGGRELADIYIEIKAENGENSIPLHFSHTMLTRPEDIKRMKDFKDICIDFSPALSYPSEIIRNSFANSLGEDRYQSFFNVKSAFEANIPTGFGSDWPFALIPDPNGFYQMQSWITRSDPENPNSGILNENQRIDLEQAILGFTLGGAHCIGFGWEEKIGSIEEGKLADFIVIDKDIFNTPIDELYKTQVLMTVVGGELVYDRVLDEELDFIDENQFIPGSEYAN